MLDGMSNPLAWIAAIGSIAATVGAWMGPVRARWQLRGEQLRTDEARRENELHRRRFTELWNWQRDQSESKERMEAARWYGEWTGAASPRRGGMDDGPQTPACTVRMRTTLTSDTSSSWTLYTSLGGWGHPGSRCKESCRTDRGQPGRQ